MKDLLKSFNVSENAIKIYLEGLGDIPYTFSEIRKIIPDFSKEEVKEILNELIEKKLVLCITPKYSKSVPHYVIIPPFSAILNSIIELSNVSEDKAIENTKGKSQLDKFQDNIYQDLEIISQDLIDFFDSQDNSNQTTEILSEVEENVKKFGQVILNDVIESIHQLKRQNRHEVRDLDNLINSVKQKISESKEIVANMFFQFRTIVKEMGSSDSPNQIETFKIFIRKLGESINKRVQEISLGVGSLPYEQIKSIETSLYNILTNYISINKISLEKFWSVNSSEKIKEIITVLLDKCTKNLTIIVPDIESYVPLDKFDLNYSDDLPQKIQGSTTKKSSSDKSLDSRPSISNKQKKEILAKFDLTAKKVAELKGFELSHDIADILAVISETNPESVVIESIQGWLNRLLVIRKHLDSNTQYLLLEAIEKWKKDYIKIKKKEELSKQKLVDELKGKLSEKKASLKKINGKRIHTTGLNIKLISSEPHDNKHALAFINKPNLEYLQLKNNNIIAIIGDNSYLVFGVCQKINNKSKVEISCFFCTYKPLIEILEPLIVEITNNAQFTNEIEISKGFNEIIENINDYTGRKISKKLKRLLNIIFEKDGISLNTLELKLLIGKLEKLFSPLNDEMKEHIIKKLNKLNNEFSILELEYPPEFRPPLPEDEENEIEEQIIPDEIIIEPIDPDKINNLFEILIERIDELKGEEICEQIDKIIEVIFKLQGYSSIIEWKNTLQTVDKLLEEQSKEKIKKDLLRWKVGLLKKVSSSSVSLQEESSEVYEDSQSVSRQVNPISILEEEYISPGLTQSQFPDEEEVLSFDDGDKTDTETEMKELFNEILTMLGDLSGIKISKKLQNIVDIILETEGYSISLKGIKNWISKLRMIRGPLESEIKEDFLLEFLKWKEKYSAEEDEIRLDFSPSLDIVEDSNDDVESRNREPLNEKFDRLIQKVNTLKGYELSEKLQEIADVVLQSHGAVTINIIRQWISKLRSIKQPLENELKEEFLSELAIWKEKFA